MKKFLLSCFLALGIGASAQYNILENFDTPSDGRIFFGNGSANTTVFCSGTTSWAANIASTAGTTQVGYAISFADKAVPQTTTGQKVSVSVNYRKTDGAGTLYLAYFVFDPLTGPSGQWSVTTFATKSLAAAPVTTCTPLSGTIPAGVLDEANLAPGSKFAIGTFFVRSSGAGVLYIDDLSIVEDVVVSPPACTTVTNPAQGATVPYGQYIMTWTAVPTATKYQVNVGTTSGGNDVFTGFVSGTSKAIPLAASSNYFATVIPVNGNGPATGCTEVAFSTSNVLGYCSAGATSTSYEKISKVLFAGINNASTSTAGYEDFTALAPALVERDGIYPVIVDISGFDSDTTVVWIDYNQDGAFDDATEKVTLTSAASATGNITIPSAAKLGNTRMRVKMYYGTANPTACGTFTFGQVEDYTVTIKEPTMATSNVVKSSVSIYPNPFQDVLKISEVKGVKSISVSDVSGRQVKNLKPSAELNLSDLKTGLYIVTLQMEDGKIQSFKAIKK
ncbi:GEVED domain-containing protein [Kaistella sp.]|uniref:GEVED domain-containing protein n=1 Tax=Kaistella sp. TaxID=2782235 RepID=UPI0035A1A8D2